MHTYVLQDWITIRGAGAAGPPYIGPGATIVQDQDDWLDLSPYQDIFFWVDCREVTTGAGNVSITFETSPTVDDSLFQAIMSSTNLSASATPTLIKAPMLSATVPIARYVRWRLTSSNGAASTWDATFRVVVAANSPGM